MEIRIIVDLRERFGKIRDQGQRPTCMAFAASDTHSFARGSKEPLSVEYAFYHAVQRMAHPDRMQAVPFYLISQAISNDGQPLESGWPYLSNLSATDEWHPPSNPGEIFKRNSTGAIANLANIYTDLDSRKPVILVIKISRSFFNVSSNTILMANNTETALNTHTVIVVGYGEYNGQKCLLIRNCWGERWGNNGYIWIHEDYLRPRLLYAGKMDETL